MYKMSAMKSDLVIFFLFFHVSHCSRRIQHGQVLSAGTEKPYVVYLVRAPMSNYKYDYWMCGGALVTSVFVVTSAACIDNVNYLYVIAGYNTYVNDSNIEKDPCTREKKKKVIFTCCPAGYNVKYEQLERWSLIDIGVVKVESPYDFNDESFKTLCSYIPTTIPINFEAKYQEPGTDALVYGWGHLQEWRKESDKSNYNQKYLNYAPVLIMEKEKCKKHYEVYNNMSEVIDRYMICTLEKGNINDQGIQIVRTTPPTPLFLNCRGEESCDEEDVSYQDIMYNSRRNIGKSNNTYNESLTEIENKTVVSDEQDVDMRNFKTSSRRYGICQNDHGGPLVTYVGTHEVLIGIASVFKVGEDSACTGPYLYTSTQCNGAFLNCVMTYKDWPNEKNRTRRSLCKKKPSDAGHATIQRHISWADHPAGPSDNEHHKTNGRNEANEKLRGKHKPEPPTFNERYEAFKKYTHREMHVGRQPGYEGYTATSKYVPHDNAAYGKHAANVMYTSNAKHAANVMDTRYDHHAANMMNGAYGHHPANVMNKASEKYSNNRYTATEKVPQAIKIDNDRLIMRPQRPLRS